MTTTLSAKFKTTTETSRVSKDFIVVPKKLSNWGTEKRYTLLSQLSYVGVQGATFSTEFLL